MFSAHQPARISKRRRVRMLKLGCARLLPAMNGAPSYAPKFHERHLPRSGLGRPPVADYSPQGLGRPEFSAENMAELLLRIHPRERRPDPHSFRWNHTASAAAPSSRRSFNLDEGTRNLKGKIKEKKKGECPSRKWSAGISVPRPRRPPCRRLGPLRPTISGVFRDRDAQLVRPCRNNALAPVFAGQRLRSPRRQPAFAGSLCGEKSFDPRAALPGNKVDEDGLSTRHYRTTLSLALREMDGGRIFLATCLVAVGAVFLAWRCRPPQPHRHGHTRPVERPRTRPHPGGCVSRTSPRQMFRAPHASAFAD